MNIAEFCLDGTQTNQTGRCCSILNSHISSVVLTQADGSTGVQSNMLAQKADWPWPLQAAFALHAGGQAPLNL